MAKHPNKPKETVKPQVELDGDLLRGGLSVLVVVVRGDGKVVQQIPWTTAVSRLIGSFLKKLPKKRFGQDKRDERLSEVLSLAGGEERTRYLSIGRKPWVWTR
jgi:hypothetical protein